MSTDVFVSYSSKDKAIAEAVSKTLELNGAKCWIAPRDVTPGKPYGECIVDGIVEAQVFVLVFSDNSNRSEQVSREVERAVGYGKSVLPFRIEDVKPTKAMEYFLSASHWLDAFPTTNKRHLQQLTRAVRSLLVDHQQGSPATDSVQTGKEKIVLPQQLESDNVPGSKGRLLLIGLLVLFLLLVGVTISLLPEQPLQSQPAPPQPFLEAMHSLEKKFESSYQSISKEDLEQTESLIEIPEHAQRLRDFIERFELEWNGAAIETYEQLSAQHRELQPIGPLSLATMTSLAKKIVAERSREFPEVDPSLQDKLVKLSDEVELSVNSIKLDRALSEIESPADDLSGFASSWQRLSTKYPNATASRQLPGVMKEIDSAQQVERWNEFYNRTEFQRLAQLSPTMASELHREGRDLVLKSPIDAFTHFAEGGVFKSREFHGEDYLVCVGAREGLVSAKLGLPIGESLHHDLYQLDLAGSPRSRYYLTNDPSELEWSKNGKLRFEVVVDSKRNTEFITLRKDRDQVIDRRIASHCTLLSDLEDRIDRSPDLTTSGWINAITSMLKRIEEDRDVDPILKVKLLEQVLSAGATGSLAIAELYQKQLEQLQSVQYDPFVKWYLPKDSVTTDARRQASKVLDRLPSLAQKMAGAQRKQSQYQQHPFAFQYRCVGWLKRDMVTNGWEAKGIDVSCPDGSLFVVVPKEAESAQKVAIMSLIGQLSGGQFKLRDRSSAVLKEGRLLYLKVPL